MNVDVVSANESTRMTSSNDAYTIYTASRDVGACIGDATASIQHQQQRCVQNIHINVYRITHFLFHS